MENIGFIQPNHVLLLVGGLIMANRLHVYRSIRGLIPVLVLSYLVYRFLTAKKMEDNLLHVFYQLLSDLERFIGVSGTVVVYDAFGLMLFFNFVKLVNDWTNVNTKGLFNSVTNSLFQCVKDISFVKKTIQEEQNKLEESFDKDLKSRSRVLGSIVTALPPKGVTEEEILTLVRSATKKEDENWMNGNVSGASFIAEKTHVDVLNKVFNYYSTANALYPDVWPSVMKFESEIIAMTANLVNGGLKTVCGTTTTGGTESVILAIKAHRDYYRDQYHIIQPELVCGITAHAAVDKACDMLGIKLIKVRSDEMHRVDLVAMEQAIGPNTIMIYGSAPSYPQGVMDNLTAMSALALKYKIGLHVDCCLGGFILPFAKQLCYNVPDFDFALPGVTSMSLDTHKYGYALKGTSVVLYRTRELRHSQYFCYADWTGGMYTTPTIAGSRSGGLIAQTWAALMYLGVEGFQKHTKDIFDTTRKIAEGVATIPDLELLGDQRTLSIIACFTVTKKSGLNVYVIGDKMHQKGWSIKSLQHPPCLHICVTTTQVGHHQRFIDDLRAAVTEVKATIAKGEKVEGTAAIYGMTSALPPGPVNELLKVYNDVILKT